MLMTINSMSPRVFIITPMMEDSRHGGPFHRAASVQPPNLPVTIEVKEFYCGTA
jgi:hypothetical protein